MDKWQVGITKTHIIIIQWNMIYQHPVKNTRLYCASHLKMNKNSPIQTCPTLMPMKIHDLNFNDKHQSYTFSIISIQSLAVVL